MTDYANALDGDKLVQIPISDLTKSYNYVGNNLISIVVKYRNVDYHKIFSYDLQNKLVTENKFVKIGP